MPRVQFIEDNHIQIWITILQYKLSTVHHSSLLSSDSKLGNPNSGTSHFRKNVLTHQFSMPGYFKWPVSGEYPGHVLAKCIYTLHLEFQSNKQELNMQIRSFTATHYTRCSSFICSIQNKSTFLLFFHCSLQEEAPLGAKGSLPWMKQYGPPSQHLKGFW